MTPPGFETTPVPHRPKSGNATLIIASIVGLSVLGAAAVVAIVIMRPNEDNATLIASVFGFIGPTTAALLALVKSMQTGASVEELKIAVNDRLTQLLAQTAKSSKAEGRDEALATAASFASAVPAAAAAAAAAAAVPPPPPAPAPAEPVEEASPGDV